MNHNLTGIDDIDYELMMYLDYDTLEQLSYVNKHILHLSKNKSFWIKKLKYEEYIIPNTMQTNVELNWLKAAKIVRYIYGKMNMLNERLGINIIGENINLMKKIIDHYKLQSSGQTFGMPRNIIHYDKYLKKYAISFDFDNKHKYSALLYTFEKDILINILFDAIYYGIISKCIMVLYPS